MGKNGTDSDYTYITLWFSFLNVQISTSVESKLIVDLKSNCHACSV